MIAFNLNFSEVEEKVLYLLKSRGRKDETIHLTKFGTLFSVPAKV